MIIILHENKEWTPPLEAALKAIGAAYQFWFVPEMDFDFDAVPTDAIYFSRMSASSHTRGNRFEPELTLGVLEWLERHSQTVVNGSRALDLEISKIRQYQALERQGIATPKTLAGVDKNRLLEGAETIGFPLISKHNRAGKGLGVQKFDSFEELKKHVYGPTFDTSLDGVNLLQQYIDAPSRTITRMEFINFKLYYAVEVDTSKGFELCPAESCEVQSGCSLEKQADFSILKNFSIENLSLYEDFLKENNVAIAGIEIIKDKQGALWTYDVNTNTNYNPKAESQARKNGSLQVARYLQSLLVNE
jgi:hypothetical protein